MCIRDSTVKGGGGGGGLGNSSATGGSGGTYVGDGGGNGYSGGTGSGSASLPATGGGGGSTGTYTGNATTRGTSKYISSNCTSGCLAGSGTGQGLLGTGSSGSYGRGGGANMNTFSNGTSGYTGAVRIMWGTDRSYPSTNVADSSASAYPTWYDLSGNGNNGTINGATYNSDGYFDFDGSNDYVSFGNILNQFPITISAWTKTNSTSENLKVDVVNKYTASSLNGYRLAFSSNGISGFYFRTSGSYTNNYDTEYGTVSTNTWYHIAMTVDSSGIKFYINGSLVGSNTWIGTAGAPTTTTNFSLGYYPGNTAGGQYYDGEILSLIHI